MRYLHDLGLVLLIPALLAGSLASLGASSKAPPDVTPAVEDPAVRARLERVRQLLEQGGDANKADAEGRTALMMASFEGHTAVAELLLDHGAEVDRRDRLGRTALMYASSGPYVQTVKLLIERGADVNRADKNEGWTALMVAAAEGHRPVVELLLRSGADVEATDKDGDTAMDHARERGQMEIVTLLRSLQRGR